MPTGCTSSRCLRTVGTPMLASHLACYYSAPLLCRLLANAQQQPRTSASATIADTAPKLHRRTPLPRMHPQHLLPACRRAPPSRINRDNRPLTSPLAVGDRRVKLSALYCRYRCSSWLIQIHTVTMLRTTIKNKYAGSAGTLVYSPFATTARPGARQWRVCATSCGSGEEREAVVER